MITHFRRIARFGIVSSILIGSSLAIHAQVQDIIPGKIRTGQSTRERHSEGRPAPEVARFWSKFAARASGPLAVTWNRRNGTPDAIYGKLSPASDVSESAARNFLATNGSLFKMSGKTGDLALTRSFASPLGRHFVFEQFYKGIPVYGAAAAVHFNHSGEIVSVNNTFQPEVQLGSVEPIIDWRMALTQMQTARGSGASSSDSAKLVIYNFDGSFRLAWQIDTLTDGPTWESFVDAQNGELLGEPRDINRYIDGTGRIFVVNAVVATRDNSLRDNNDAASAVPASAYATATLQGLIGNGFLDGQFASSSKTKKQAFSVTNSFLFDRSNDGFSETMGYYYIDYAERYIQSLGFNNINNRQQVFSVNRLKVDNSYYSPQSEEITLGIGGVDDAEDADVIVHEYGHSIQDNQVPGFGRTLEAGSMGEGFGDYWAGTIGAQFSGGFQDECIAEWDATSYSSSNPPCLRRLDGTKHYPEDVEGEVHADGEIWSAALWEIRGAVGATNADRTILAAHFLLSPDATFNQGANAVVTSAVSLGLPSRSVNRIRSILQNRGFTVTV
jgi:Zn-dependent metalloprotease